MIDEQRDKKPTRNGQALHPHELLRQAMLLDAFFEHTPSPVVTLDKDFNFLRVSQAYADACGRTVEEFAGRNHFELYPSDAQPIFEEVVRRKKAHRATARPFRFPDQPERGVTYWDWSLVPLLDERGEVEILVFLLNEVTEFRKTEEKLKNQLQFEQTLIDAVPVPIFYKDLQGKYLGCNKAFEKLYRLERQEVVGKTVFDIAPADLAEVYSAHDRHLFENPGIQVYESVFRDGSGQILDVVFHKATFLDSDGKVAGLVGALLDISGRKRTEEALAAHVARVESLNDDLQDFAFVASHDLMEPLRKIQGFGDLLRDRFRSIIDEEGKDYLDRMTRAANRMEILLTALLDYSRLGERKRQFKPVDLGKVVREVVNDLEWTFKECNGCVEIGDLPVVEADAVQMRQVFQNLISNSLKYRRENAQPLIRVHGVLEAGIAKIYVEDNGIGFKEEYLDRIFKPFHRLHGRSAYEGIGMGLAICRKIIERHGGGITASSVPGEGSTFVFSLPERQPAWEEPPPPPEATRG